MITLFHLKKCLNLQNDVAYPACNTALLIYRSFNCLHHRRHTHLIEYLIASWLLLGLPTVQYGPEVLILQNPAEIITPYAVRKV
jgi:hypothetical protein